MFVVVSSSIKIFTHVYSQDDYLDFEWNIFFWL